MLQSIFSTNFCNYLYFNMNCIVTLCISKTVYFPGTFTYTLTQGNSYIGVKCFCICTCEGIIFCSHKYQFVTGFRSLRECSPVRFIKFIDFVQPQLQGEELEGCEQSAWLQMWPPWSVALLICCSRAAFVGGILFFVNIFFLALSISVATCTSSVIHKNDKLLLNNLFSIFWNIGGSLW